MIRPIIKLLGYLKGFVILSRPHILLGWLRHPFLLISNTLAFSKWLATQDKKNIFNDFYTLKRDHGKRFSLYQHIIDKQKLNNEAIDYLEFGISGAFSFKWWIKNCQHAESKFFGFDTFEGLPEHWGTYDKGEMAAQIPTVEDNRAKFIKGLFQDSLPEFLKSYALNNGKRKVIHLDADLFSSTLYALTSLAPYLSKGDILLFDEFNVPNHEFFAFKMFSDSFYVKTKLLGAVNNYLQVALIIE